jgi:hypothetical protein
MKFELFVAASLILVVGIVATIPNAQATKHQDQGQWCYTSVGLGAVCGFDSMANCKHSAMAEVLLFHTAVKLQYLNCYQQ